MPTPRTQLGIPLADGSWKCHLCGATRSSKGLPFLSQDAIRAHLKGCPGANGASRKVAEIKDRLSAGFLENGAKQAVIPAAPASQPARQQANGIQERLGNQIPNYGWKPASLSLPPEVLGEFQSLLNRVGGLELKVGDHDLEIRSNRQEIQKVSARLDETLDLVGTFLAGHVNASPQIEPKLKLWEVVPWMLAGAATSLLLMHLLGAFDRGGRVYEAPRQELGRETRSQLPSPRNSHAFVEKLGEHAVKAVIDGLARRFLPPNRGA